MADLSDNTNWFETDASNNKASPNGWPEGMMPSGVNDTARGDKGALKRFWDRINPVQYITPSGNAWTFVTDNLAYPGFYAEGEIFCFKSNGVSVGNDIFNVNSLPAKTIVKLYPDGSWQPIQSRDILIGMTPQLVYDPAISAGAGKAFILTNPYVPTRGDGAGGINTSGVSSSGLIQTSYNGSGSGGVSIYATAGGIRSDVGGTALYLPNGNVVCVSLTQSSDIRIKRDVWGYDAGLAEVTALRPITYCFNGRGGTVEDGRRHIGLIADEVEGVMPEMVDTMSRLLDPDDRAPTEIKTLDTTSLIFALVNCVKELAARVASLEADVRD